MSTGFFDASVEGLDGVEADYVIVGSGAGGGAAARVLADATRSVVVLEEGPLVDRTQLGAIARRSMSKLFRHAGQSAALGRTAIPILQGRVVGGTTFVNSAIVWRIPEKILHRWHEEFGLAEALPETALESAYATLESEMSVRPVGDRIANNADRLMKLGAERLHIEHRAIQRYDDGCQGTGRCFHGCPHDAKQSTTVNYLRRAAGAGAAVVSNARVDRVLVEGGRAAAVRGRILGDGTRRGGEFVVRAKKAVIVCASVVQSPNLLARSRLGIGDALGRHFTAHPGTAVMGLYPQPVNTWLGAAQGYEVFGMRDTLGVKFESINVPPEVTASRLPGAGRRFVQQLEKLPYLANWAAAVRAEAEGTVRPSRIFGGDLIRYTLTPGDVKRLREGLRKLAEMHFAAGATEVFAGITGMPESIKSPDELKYFDAVSLDPANFHCVATHLFGTCRAGKDPRTSVVDPNLKVHGVDGLYVMDASVFPTNTGVNPQHSIMAVAMVAARRLAAA